MSADDDALLARRVDKIVAITDPETVEPTQAASDARVHGHVDPRDGFPRKSECCGRSCCQGPAWHLFPFCAIREALTRREHAKARGTDA